MKMRIQVTIEYDDETTETVTEEITVLDRATADDSPIGLTLADSKAITSAIQQVLVAQQVAQLSQRFCHCQNCDKAHKRNGRETVIYRTLFGNIRLPSQRYYHCDCHKHASKTFSTLTELLPERTAPEFSYLQAKWSSLISYGQTVKLLEEVLPLAANVSSARRRTHETGERLEAELEADRDSYIEGDQNDWAQLPPPEQRLFVGIDGGFVRNSEASSTKTEAENEDKSEDDEAKKEPVRRHFEIIVGKTMEADANSKRFAFVQTLDEKPRSRVFDTLQTHGMQMNWDVTFLTDGADDVRNLPANLNPQSDHLIDWFHVTMKLTNLKQIAKGIAVDEQVKETLTALESIKHFLWHGQVNKGLAAIQVRNLAKTISDSGLKRSLNLVVSDQ